MHIPSIATRAVIVLMIAAPAMAAPLTVSVDPSRATTMARGFNVTVKGAEGDPVHAVVAFRSSLQLDVPPGLYRIALAEPAYWADERSVYVSESGGAAQLIVYRASAVAGHVTVKGNGRKIYESLTVRFQSADDSSGGPRGETTCNIVRRSFSCAVPAVRLDLSLKAAGCITRFRWGVDATASTANVGEIDLVPGALLTGYVSAPRGVSVENALVRAAPRRSAPSVHDSTSTLSVLSAHVNPRGFFHFDGIAPGEYTIEASSASRKSPRKTVRVIESAEAEVREPLVLQEPHDLEFVVEPVRDPYNRRWIVELERQTDVDMVVETERQESLPEDGHATFQAIPAGDYTVVLRSQGGETWAQRDITVPLASLVEITLPKTLIRGRLTLDGQPLSASLEFHGNSGVAVAARSRHDGKFALFFPQKDIESIDQVRVRSDAPRINRVLSAVAIEHDDDGKRTVNIDLPATYLTGFVVDSSGQAVTRAIVRIESLRERTTQEVPVDADGSFEVHAVAAGRVELRAYAAKAASNAISLEVVENERSENVRLVVQPTVRLTGRVLSATGPIPGAVVYAFPHPRGAFLTPVNATDADGRYDISLPAETVDVDLFVAAPAFATQCFRHPVTKSEDMDLMLSQTSGALSIDDADGDELVIQHRGAEIGIKLFTFHGAVRRDSVFRIVNLEPGAYAVCKGQACTAAVVVPHGEVHARVK
jgi:hypothetical protein